MSQKEQDKTPTPQLCTGITREPTPKPHFTCSKSGLPNVRPWGRMRPPGPLYAAPRPSSKDRAGRENYYCYLLIVHFYIYIADIQCTPAIVLSTLAKDSLL